MGCRIPQSRSEPSSWQVSGLRCGRCGPLAALARPYAGKYRPGGHRREKSDKPWAFLTGDTLFIGDVGRPDLSESHTPAELAGLLFDSLHNKLLKLPDDVLGYPAHGAGSLCGRNLRAERSSTIASERLTNYALHIGSRQEFIRELTAKMPVRPEYFLQDAEINRDGASALSVLPELAPIPAPLRAACGSAQASTTSHGRI